MKILYVSQYYPPEIGAPAARVSELSKLWSAAGHEVTVLTGFPNHPTGKVPREYRRRLWGFVSKEDQAGVTVQRTWLLPLPNRKNLERMLNYFSFFASASVRGLFLPGTDVVIGSSPQLLVGLAAFFIARWKRAPFVFEVRDLWPESLEAVGASNRKSLLVRALSKVAGFLYRHADHIAVVTGSFKDHLVREWKVPVDKISVIVNGVDQEFFHPQAPDAEIAREFGIEGRVVAGFIGTIGQAHGIETLVEAARLLQQSDPNVVFLVVGEGAEKEKLERLAAENKLKNFKIFAGQPRTRIPGIVACTQFCLVLLRSSELFKTVIPTKMLEFMSCGRAIIGGLEGEAAELIKRSGAGICVSPGDAQAVADAIRFLKNNPVEATKAGTCGRSYAVQHLSREGTARDYLLLLTRVCGEAQPAHTSTPDAARSTTNQ